MQNGYEIVLNRRFVMLNKLAHTAMKKKEKHWH